MQPTGVYATYCVPPLEAVAFGQGALAHLDPILQSLEAKRVFVITTRSVAPSRGMERVRASIGSRLCGEFTETKAHVPESAVFAAAQQMRQAGADTLVSFGGGTATDTAKDCNLLLASGAMSWADLAPLVTPRKRRSAVAAFETVRVPGPVLPHIAIPTTLSGGEFTFSASMKHEESRSKQLFIYYNLAPRFVILDPEVTLETPRELWLSSGVKAIDHCVETLYATDRQPVCTALAEAGLAALVQHLPFSVGEPADLEIRSQCQTGAWLAIFGIMNVRLGLSHAIGHQVGARWGTPHGITSCLTMPAVIEFNAKAAGPRMHQIARSMGLRAAAGEDAQAVGARVARTLRRIIRGMGLPTRLREVGADRKDFAPIAEHVLGDPLMASNPRRVERAEEILPLLDAMW
jgi:alcohol dehydrogenase class IV